MDFQNLVALMVAALDLVQFVPQFVDAFFDEPAIDFELLFAGPAHADAHLDAREVGP